MSPNLNSQGPVSTPLTGTDADNARSGNEICFNDAKKVAAINLFTAGDFDVRAEGEHQILVDKDCAVLVERGDRKIKTEKGAIILEAEDQILLQSGKSTLCLTKDSVEIKSPKVHLNFSSVTSPENLKIKEVDQPKFDKADHDFARAATVVAIAKTDHEAPKPVKTEARPEFRDSAEQQALAESLDVSADISDVEAGLEIATSLFVEEIGVGEVEDADAVRRIAKASVERGEAKELINVLGEKETGGRTITTVSDYYRNEGLAEKYYSKIRNADNNDDVKLISKNTGISEIRMNRIKQHVFFNEHELKSGIGRFFPDIEIADAWDRLQVGNYTEQDLKLMEHEYFEAKYEGIFKTTAQQAHEATESTGRKWKPGTFTTTSDMQARL